MLKTQAMLEVKINENLYQFCCDAQCSLGEIYDALCKMRGYVISRMQDEQKASEPKPSESKIEELVEVVD